MKLLPRFLVFTLAAGLSFSALSGCASQQAHHHAADERLAHHTIPDSTNFAGSYLSARFAQQNQDWHAAQKYLHNVLHHDDANDRLRQKAFLLTLGSGHTDKAEQLAERILTEDPESEIALIFLSAAKMKKGDYAAAEKLVHTLPDAGFGRYTKPLLSAWSLAGQGRIDNAKALLQNNGAENDAVYHLHIGLMSELDNDMNAAATHYKHVMEDGLTLHSAILVGTFFDRYGQPEISNMIYDGLGQLYTFNPFVTAVRTRELRPVIEPNVTTAADGAALALFDLATALYERKAYDSAQVYGSIVQMLSPESPNILLMLGDIAALRHQYGKALAHYDAIDPRSPLFWLSKLRTAEIHEANNNLPEAIALLKKLGKFAPTHINAMVSLGDIYRRHESFAQAVEAYDAALTNIDELTEKHWPIIYARGMALERMNKWNMAEKDLLKALELQPENPMILNYIGYTWVDQGVNMERAVGYIRKAVALRPNDGYILDSYGWAHFRMGQFDEAVKWLERAVAQVPDDPTMLDHLGDAYWQVGRYNEAKFKWQRAIEISKDAAFQTLIQRKMIHGIMPVAPLPIVQKEARL
ncbi:MAG: tetratricopeptide repeat protein [Alphaproteobacteria bacterium]|nr:tetratricopeptide repeat protein [Alphaproteobacteria bacterium]